MRTIELKTAELVRMLNKSADHLDLMASYIAFRMELEEMEDDLMYLFERTKDQARDMRTIADILKMEGQ